MSRSASLSNGPILFYSITVESLHIPFTDDRRNEMKKGRDSEQMCFSEGSWHRRQDIDGERKIDDDSPRRW